MNKTSTILLALSLAMPASLLAQDAPPGELPPDHPSVGEPPVGEPAGEPLPPGHPDVAPDEPAPEGHGPPAEGELPPGHPPSDAPPTAGEPTPADDPHGRRAGAIAYTARLTIDVTPDLRGRIKVTAFQRGQTVADMLRELLAGAFPAEGDAP